MNTRPFTGVFAATLTPYAPDGAVDAGVARTLTRLLINEGVNGVCPAGTTGEFPLLSREEKAAVNAAACEAAGEEGRVIAGVWGNAADQAWLARDAAGHGASAVFLTTPIFYPAGPEAQLAWYRGVARATTLPLFAYNIPQFSANEIPLPVLDTLAAEGTIKGYKDSSPDPARLEAVVKLLKGRVAVFAGSENLFPAAKALGVDGFISGLANVFPRTVVAVWNGDRGAVDRLAAVKEVVKRCGGIPAMKYLLTLRGIAIGPAREPIAPLSDATRRELEVFEKEFGKEL
jgi:dihydrodipicolinate synthase/N-acetylneuraminate lyase